MTKYFRVESLEQADTIKVHLKSNEKLPIKIDCNQRFSTHTKTTEENLDKIHDFEVRKDDVWVITQPKSGTTWMLELVWLLQNNLDFETALKTPQTKRAPYLELSNILPTLNPNSFDEVAGRPSPRLIKSHLAIHMLPVALWKVQPKIIFVTRNPLDTIVSAYYHRYTLGTIKGTLEDYVELTIKNKMISAPFGIQTFEFWQLRNEPYVYFTSFERMKHNLRSVIVGLCEFLQIGNITEEKMVKLLDHLSFEKMKNNVMCNQTDEIQMFREHTRPDTPAHDFLRNGKVNSFKAELSEELQEKVEKWHEELLMKFGYTYEDVFFPKEN